MFHIKINKSIWSLFNFATRSLILALIFIISYHLTIGITLTKVDKIVDQVVWAKEKIESMDQQLIEKAFHRLPSKIEFSDSASERLRTDTKIWINKLSPIIDEFYLYKPKSN
jgi:hypothetical protein